MYLSIYIYIFTYIVCEHMYIDRYMYTVYACGPIVDDIHYILCMHIYIILYTY